MGQLFGFLNTVTDWVIYPFSWGNAVFGLSLVSLVCAWLLLLSFKRISSQDKIKYHKNKIVGYILEIGLFRDQFAKTFVNQGRILFHNLTHNFIVAHLA